MTMEVGCVAIGNSLFVWGMFDFEGFPVSPTCFAMHPWYGMLYINPVHASVATSCHLSLHACNRSPHLSIFGHCAILIWGN